MKLKKRYWIIALIALLIIGGIFYQISKNKDPYEFKGNTLYYSENRGEVKYELLSKTTNGSLEVYKIKYDSKNFLDNPTKIYGLMFIPQEKKNIPGLVLLPGGGGSKEQEAKLASQIANLGYAVLTIDQRGIGETGGAYLNFEQDYAIFSQGKEPIQHLSVYDGLKAYDVLANFKEAQIDKNNLGFAGESMGGRYAIIAAAIEKKSKGVIAISAAGFHIEINPIQTSNNYYVSIDPDHYIGSISPRFVAMLQGTNDSVVKPEDAGLTYSKAKEPKRFFFAQNCAHGYCDRMFEGLKEDLKEMFNQ